MCGICGVVRFDGKPIAAGIQTALHALRHRGPDHSEIWSLESETICLEWGASRLAVLDPSARADQPFHRDRRFHLLYNGEVYNFRQLRNELSRLGEEFFTEGDTEVVLAACAHWGRDALTRLEGMWSLAFLDSQTRSGFLARDPIGIKPLVYAVSGQELAFASEVRALAKLGTWKKEVDAGAVAQHLVFGYIADPATIYRAAWRLPPGHCLAFGPAGISEPRRYGDLPFAGLDHIRSIPPTQGTDYGSARSGLRRLIGDAVARQRVSDVPVGAFLSGGLDSSIVVSHLAESTPAPVHTFCVGYADQQSYDERAYARLVADRFGTRHEEIVLDQADVLASIPWLLDHLGEPVGDSSIVPTSLVSRAARQFVTVALSGDGGDELFGGYWRYLAHKALEKYFGIPGILRRGLIEPLLAVFAASRTSTLGNRVRQFRKLIRSTGGDALDRHAAWSRILPESAAILFLDPMQVKRCVESMVSCAREYVSGDFNLIEADPLNAVLQLDLVHQLPGDMLHKVDLAGMMHSLEVRVPLLDLAVVRTVSLWPSSYKVYRGMRKRALIDAYRGHLPDEVLDRPKQGFEVPVGELLRGPMRDMFWDTVGRDTIESFGMLSYATVEKLYADHCSFHVDYSEVLWALLSLCWWKRLAC